MHFQLRIDLGSDAMQDASDVGRALIELGERLHDCDWINTPARIKDLNGNTVGRWALAENGS